MLKVNGKEVVFSTWFMIQHTDTAEFDMPVLPGAKMKFEIMQKPGELQHVEQEVSVEAVGKDYHFKFAYLREKKSHATDIREFIMSPQGIGSYQVSRQALEGAMLVHFVLYHTAHKREHNS